MINPWMDNAFRHQRRVLFFAALFILLLTLLTRPSAYAEPFPTPEVPLASVYTSWLENEIYAKEFWIRGMNSRHWIAPSSHAREWLNYSKDEIKVLPESGLVLRLSYPAVLDHLSPLVDGDDMYGNQLMRGWVGALRRDVVTRENYLASQIRKQRRQLLLDKAKLTRTQVMTEDAHGSLIDINIPLKLPKRIERIVGKGEKSNITVTGRESISFSGQTDHRSNYIADETGKGQSLFPRLEMKQDLQVKLSGTVGEKIHVEVENNSNAMGGSANKIRIRYEGDEDEVVKLIEMGDTQLNLPSSGLISYSASNKGLFGIKVNGNVGALDFTAIASKQEGEVQSKTFNASGQSEQSTFIYDTSYLANQFFFLDDPYQATGQYNLEIDMATLNIFINDQTSIARENDDKYVGFAFYDLAGDGELDIDPEQLADGGGVKGIYRKLETNEYQLGINDSKLRYIRLLTPLQENHVLAVSFRTMSGEHVGTTAITQPQYWTLDSSAYSTMTYENTESVLHMELIKPSNYTPESPTWDYMMRNVYRLGGRDIDVDALDLQIERLASYDNPERPEGESQVQYLQIFGLDTYSNSSVENDNNPRPNGKVDPKFVDEQNGLLFFPILEPFNPAPDSVLAWTENVTGVATGGYVLAEEDPDRNPELYAIDYQALRQDPTLYSKYKISFVSASASSRFNLNAFNVIEGSESVVVDGRALNRGTDYKIDYFSGEVELIGEAARDLRPDSQVSIKCETKPLFGGGKSSLIGFNGTYNLGNRNRISSSWLFESQASGARRPRIGEESTRNIVGNILGSYSASPMFLTTLINTLPRVDTDAPSTLNMSGELALSYPNPNVDNNAYVDDMEGAEDADELGIQRAMWQMASAPITDMRVPGGADIPALASTRADLYYWYNPHGEMMPRRSDFNLNLQSTEADDNVEVLRLNVPAHLSESDVANFSKIGPINDANNARGDSLWVGLMRGFGGEGLDLSEAEYIEIWVNDFQQDKDHRVGRIHFDLGAIDEDFWKPERNSSQHDTEDFKFPTGTFRESEEDVGLDQLHNDEEPDIDHPLEDSDSPAWGGSSDMSGDDYVAGSHGNMGYFKINGMENNGRLDTEDFNGNGLLDEVNSYFTLDFSLADSAIIDMVDVYQEAGEGTPQKDRAWRLYRLNLDEARIASDDLGNPNWSRIQYFRFWVEGLNTPTGNLDREYLTALEIASIKIVGNRWKSHGIQEVATGETLLPGELGIGEDMRVEVINDKEHSTFVWPYSTETNPETGLKEREQALSFLVEDIEPGHQAVIRKNFTKLNLMGYESLSFWVKADEATVGHDIFLRAAFDSTEFYEIVLRPENERWLEVNFDLSAWTDLKLSADRDTVSTTIYDKSVTGREYTIRCIGRPELTNIRHLFLGVVNDAESEELSGEVWFNDIRVKNVRRDMGYAGKINGSVSFGGIISLNASYDNRSADFRSLGASSGSNTSTRSWSVSGSTKIGHFLPMRGYEIPISLSYSRSNTTPKYKPNSNDILIADDVLKERYRTSSVKQGFSTSLMRTPSRRWLSRTLLDNLKISLQGSQSKIRGPSNATLSESVNYSVSHNTSFKEREIKLFRGYRFRWVPASIKMSSKTSRSWTKRWSSLNDDSNLFTEQPYSQSGSMNNSFDLKWDFFPSFKTTYSIGDRRELLHDDAQRVSVGDVDINLGFQKSLDQSFSCNYTVPFIRRFKPRIVYTSKFSQTNQASVAGLGETASGSRNFSGRNEISTGYTFKIGKLFKKMVGDRLKSERQPGVGAPPPTQPPVQMRRRGSRIRCNVDPLRGPDPRMLSRKSRRWFPETTPVIVEPVAAVADSVEVEEGVDAMFVVWKTLSVLGELKDLKVDIRRDVNHSYSQVRGKAGALYRFGFSESLDLPAYSATGADRLVSKDPDTYNEGRQLKMSTGLTVGGVVSITTKFNQTSKNSNSSRSRMKTMKRKWPDFSLEVLSVEKWPVWGGKFKSSSIGFGVARDLDTTENLGTSSSTKTVRLGVMPHWNVTWHSRMTTNLNFNYNSDTNFSVSNTTKNVRLGGDFKMSYSMSAPNGLNLPGLRGVHFSSSLDLSLSLKYNRTSNYMIQEGQADRNISGSSNFSIDPSANYKFSQKLSGNARLSFSRNHNKDSGQTTTSVGLSVGATFVF
ncbi:MAG: cell surface protein SprA [bacterium]|nr:cell surface protein SprA [bacterium]